jgi:hypothetical protein
LLKSATLIIISIVFISGYWFYNKMTSPQLVNGDISHVKRVTNLPWQITIIDDKTLHVFDLLIGKSTLKDAVKVLKSEYNLAWFENKVDSQAKDAQTQKSDANNLNLEAYFFRVSLSGLRAKVILELDTTNLDLDYLKTNSGKPEILASHAIKYPLDDLAQAMGNRLIKSLTYVPKSSVDIDILRNRFGQAGEVIQINENLEFWLYPEKGLVMTINKKGKEAFQYVPTSDFERLRKTVLKTQRLSK